MKISICYVPFPTKEDALSAIRTLISEKLIACGNVVSSESIFFWNGENRAELEWIAIIKTSTSKIIETRIRLMKIHPYETPAILDWLVNANDDYVAWVEKEVNS